jgi:hypothetical protein
MRRPTHHDDAVMNGAQLFMFGHPYWVACFVFLFCEICRLLWNWKIAWRGLRVVKGIVGGRQHEPCLAHLYRESWIFAFGYSDIWTHEEAKRDEWKMVV